MSKSRGAKYLRAKKPVSLAYFETFPDLKTAMLREIEVKSWNKAKKEELLNANSRTIVFDKAGI